MQKKQIQAKIISETFWSFAAKGVAFFCFYATNIFLARFLGVDGFGSWSFFFSFLSIVLVLSRLGISPATQYFMAKYNDTEFLKSVWHSSIKLRLITTTGFSLLYLALSYPLATLLGIPEMVQLIILSVPLVFISGFVEYLKSVSTGLHILRYNFIITSMEYVLKLVLVIAFLLLANNFASIVGAYTLSLMIVAIVAYTLIRKNFSHLSALPKRDFTKELIDYAKLIFLISVGIMISAEVDILMIGMLREDTEVGVYAGAKQLVLYLPHISIAISMGTMPPFAKLDDSNKERLRRLYRRLLLINTALFGCIGLGVFLLSDWLVPLILGDEYRRSATVLKLLIPYVLAMSFAPFIDVFLDYQGQVKKRAINYLIAMVLNIILNIVLIPRYGAIGAACATSLSFVPCLVLNSFYAKKVWARYL